MRKTIFFDLDGTLVSHRQGRIPDSTIAALNELKAKGARLVVATGRQPQNLEWMLNGAVRFDGYITINGQFVMDSDGNCIYRNPIAPDDMRVIAKAFAEKNTALDLVEEEGDYANMITDVLAQVQAEVITELPRVGSYTGNPVYMVRVYGTREELERITSGLSSCKSVQWNRMAYDIIPKVGGKLIGIQEYLRANGIDQADTIAFGDDENDMDMLRFVSCGIAMGNALEKVKRLADHVIGGVDEDGIWNAIHESWFLDLFK